MKRKKIWIFPLVIMGVLLIITNSCKKKDDPTPTGQLPVLTTSVISAITQTTVTCGGNITSDGGSTVTARGVCWSTGQTPAITDSKTTDSTGVGSFTSSITGLSANTLYYVRAYATNSIGTGYGSATSFTTQTTQNSGIIFNPNLTYGTVTDIDGNVYKTITIGTQTWMAENLKTTKYRNGNSIPNITDGTAWSNLTTGACCNFNNDANNSTTYGRLYNWYAVSDTRNIAPAGWHVPTDAEWTTLTTYLGGNSVAGGKLKEIGTTHWASPNTGADNSSGFTALPGGIRFGSGSYANIGHDGFHWSATEYNATSAWYRYLPYDYAGVYNSGSFGGNDKVCGLLVRCLRD